MSVIVIFQGGPNNGRVFRTDSRNPKEAKIARTIFHATGQGTVGRKCDHRSYYALPLNDLPEMCVPDDVHRVTERRIEGGHVYLTVRHEEADCTVA